MRVTAADWKTVAAAVAGPNKAERGCQDATAIRRVGAGERSALVVALADGAGSARHGGDAARLIVQTLADATVSRLRRRLARGAVVPPWTPVDMAAVFDRARGAVTRAATAQSDALRDWGSTGLLIVATAEATVLGQIGDGAMCLRHAGVWSCPIWPDLDGYVNVTAFVTQPDAPLRTHVAPPADALLAFSDGLQPLVLDYQTGLPHTPFCAAVIAELAKGPDLRILQEQLARWLASDTIRSRSDDDISLAMALRVTP